MGSRPQCFISLSFVDPWALGPSVSSPFHLSIPGLLAPVFHLFVFCRSLGSRPQCFISLSFVDPWALGPSVSSLCLLSIPGLLAPVLHLIVILSPNHCLGSE